MRVLYIAEIVGNSGLWCIRHGLKMLCKQYAPDFIIANADGATGGKGIGKRHVGYLHKQGIDLMTSGDCVFFKKDLADDFEHESRIIRAFNLPEESPGRGYKICTVEGCNQKLAVINALGQSGNLRLHAENPFTSVPPVVQSLRADGIAVIVDFHAATTAEKKAFFYTLDGKASAVIGSHGRVQTADCRVSVAGTAAITDAGRTGSLDSVDGCDPIQKITEYRTGIPDWTRDAWENIEIQGMFITINKAGYADFATPVRFALESPSQTEGTADVS